VASLVKLIRRLERLSRPRLTGLFRRRPSSAVFGLLVLAGRAGAFFAPPFSGLDTLPALGVVLLSLGLLLEDILVAIGGTIIAAVGVVLEVTLGSLAARALGSLF
jgi:hypothetical protein